MVKEYNFNEFEPSQDKQTVTDSPMRTPSTPNSKYDRACRDFKRGKCTFENCRYRHTPSVQQQAHPIALFQNCIKSPMSIDQNYDRTAKYNAFSPRDSPREGKKLWESRKKLWDSYNDQTNSESIEGVLRVNKKNRNEGYVRTNEKDWFIPSLNLMNRALDSAKVKIAKLSPKEAENEKRE